MVRCLLHESFYRSGTFVNQSLGVAVGWVSHGGSFSDCMPVWNETRDVCLVYSGEDMADPATIAQLRTRGHDFIPGNASYLVHWYEEEGLRFLEKLNGMFSGLIIDLRDQKIVLFNDRFGVNRINLWETKDSLYFSSEAKSILRVIPEARRLDCTGLGEYFSNGCVLQNRTIFSGIHLLPGGAVWTFSPGRPVRKELYFRKESWEDQPVLSAAEYYQKLKETWLRILPRYFGGAERVGLSLTGGVDSRLILACAPCPPEGLACYSFGGMYRECADVTLSRTVAALCRQPHQTVVLDRSFLAEFPVLAEKTAYVSDGTMDPTATADLFVNRLARQIAPVRMTGLNGGEILRRLLAFKPRALCPGLFATDFYRFGEEAALTYQAELQGNLQSFVAFKQAAWHLYPRLSIERSQIAIRSPYFDNEIVALAYQAPPECVGMDPALRLIAEAAPALKQVGTDRAVRLNPVPGITWAQHQLQEFTFKAEYAYDYGMPHWLARADRAVQFLHCERLFLGRHKFYHYRLWYRDEFAKFLKEVLLDGRARSRPYLDGAGLEDLVSRHTTGRGNYTTELHRLLTLELAQRQLVD
jgi:asparagine synthase (glutamine-hydrolysing)